jgi:hypothetical protein
MMGWKLSLREKRSFRQMRGSQSERGEWLCEKIVLMPVLKPITSLTCLCYFTLYPLFLVKLYASPEEEHQERKRQRICGGEKEDPIRRGSQCVAVYTGSLFSVDPVPSLRYRKTRAASGSIGDK